MHRFASIIHALALQSPGSKPVFEVLEGFEAFSTTNNLRRVVASEKSVRSLAHVLGGNAETDHGSVDYSVILERPQVVQLLFLNIFVWR